MVTLKSVHTKRIMVMAFVVEKLERLTSVFVVCTERLVQFLPKYFNKFPFTTLDCYSILHLLCT